MRRSVTTYKWIRSSSPAQLCRTKPCDLAHSFLFTLGVSMSKRAPSPPASRPLLSRRSPDLPLCKKLFRNLCRLPHNTRCNPAPASSLASLSRPIFPKSRAAPFLTPPLSPLAWICSSISRTFSPNHLPRITTPPTPPREMLRKTLLLLSRPPFHPAHPPAPRSSNPATSGMRLTAWFSAMPSTSSFSPLTASLPAPNLPSVLPRNKSSATPLARY